MGLPALPMSAQAFVSVLAGVSLSFDCSAAVRSMNGRVCLGVLASIPLSFAYRAIPRGSVAKHLFSAAAGSLVVVLATSMQHFVHMALITLVSYALVHLVPRARSGWAVLLCAMGHLIAIHSARDGVLAHLLDEARFAWVHDVLHVREYPVLVMGATLKAAGFALSWADGARPVERLPRLHASQRLAHLPGLLRFWAYIFFFPSVYGHPLFFSYAEFELAAGDEPPLCAAAALPVPLLPALDGWLIAQRHCEGLAFGAAHALSLRFTPHCAAGVYTPFSCYCTSVLTMAMFYGFWRVSDGPLLIAGLLPSSQLAGAVHFSRVRHTLLAPDFATALRMWNLPVTRFLKVHVYARSPRACAPAITLLFSALWHGVAPGYFVTAFSAVYFLAATRALRGLAPLVAPPSRPLAHGAWCAAGRALSHAAWVFLFLQFLKPTGAEALALLRAVRCAPYVVASALLLAGRLSALASGATGAGAAADGRDTEAPSLSTRVIRMMMRSKPPMKQHSV